MFRGSHMKISEDIKSILVCRRLPQQARTGVLAFSPYGYKYSDQIKDKRQYCHITKIGAYGKDKNQKD